MRLGIDLFPLQERASYKRGIGIFTRNLTLAIQVADPSIELIYYVVAGMPLWDLPRGTGGAKVIAIAPAADNYFCNSWALDLHLAHGGGNPDRLDVLLSTNPLQSLVWKYPGSPRRVSLHYDVVPEYFPEKHIPSPELRESYAETMKLLRTYDAILTLSEHARSELITRHHFAPDAITVIGSGISPCFRPAETAAELAEDLAVLTAFDLTPGGYILNVGGTDPRKGAARLIEAYALLPSEHREANRLVFAFDASPMFRRDLTMHADNLGLPHGAVVCTGWVADRTLVALNRGASLMCFPSLYEGFGLPIAEAQACGTPVVAGDNSSQPEVGGDAAVLVDATQPIAIAEGMSRILSHPHWADLLRTIGEKTAKRFHWGTVARRALAVLSGTGGGGSSDPRSPSCRPPDLRSPELRRIESASQAR